MNRRSNALLLAYILKQIIKKDDNNETFNASVCFVYLLYEVQQKISHREALTYVHNIYPVKTNMSRHNTPNNTHTHINVHAYHTTPEQYADRITVYTIVYIVCNYVCGWTPVC